uniref:hypothetical protein n=1 Tax=Ruminococcus sp. TaxID=41978 RepID=UPI003A94FBDB
MKTGKKILAGVIYTEQVLNVNLIDVYTDCFAASSLVDTSVGIAQVKMSTAELVEDAGLMGHIDAKMYGTIVTSHHQQRYIKLCD